MKITFTKQAQKKYESIVEYLRNEWSVKVAAIFINRTKNLLDLLESFPCIGTIEVPDKKIRGLLISKYTKIFYRVKGNRIIILSLFDQRQDPFKNKYKMR